MQQVSNVEFYVTCADVRIVGSSAPPADVLRHVSPQVQITGTSHLGRRSQESVHYGQYGQSYLVGPAVASYGGPTPDSEWPGCDAPCRRPNLISPTAPSPPPSSPAPPPQPLCAAGVAAHAGCCPPSGSSRRRARWSMARSTSSATG